MAMTLRADSSALNEARGGGVRERERPYLRRYNAPRANPRDAARWEPNLVPATARETLLYESVGVHSLHV